MNKKYKQNEAKWEDEKGNGNRRENVEDGEMERNEKKDLEKRRH